MGVEPDSSNDLRQYLRATWRGKWLFLAIVVSVPLAVFLFSASLPKTYEATVTLQVGATAVDTTLFTDQPAPIGSTAAAVRLISTSGVAEEAAQNLDPPPEDARALLGKISVSDDQAGFVDITAQDGDADRAAEIANAWAEAVITTRTDDARERVGRAVATIEENLANLPRRDTAGRRQLSQQLQRLRALRAAQGSNTSIIEPAVVPSEPVSPKPLRNTLLALFVAIALGFAAVSLADRLDRRIRQPNQIERILRAPLLGIIPEQAFPGNPPSAQVRESFQTLRASLTYFNVDRPITSVMVVSAQKEDGKTTVSTNLAVALARGGKKVILVDTDLRRPQVGVRMGVDAEHGVGEVLAGERSLDEALVEVDVGDARLQVLPAGAPPPNPSELLASQRMRTLLAELNKRSEIVVIDSTPLLPVSDAIPLLEQVSGAVVVGRVNQTTRDALDRLREVLEKANGTVFGVVASGAPGHGLDEYSGYGYGYGGGGEEEESAQVLQPGSALTEHKNGDSPFTKARRRLARN